MSDENRRVVHMDQIRIEKDSMGEMKIPVNHLWGAQTARSLIYFSPTEEKMDNELIHSIVLIKKAAAQVHEDLKMLPIPKARAIRVAADEILTGKYPNEFPLSLWQTGSGTQTNMNVNEVLANLASEILGGERGSERLIHPNDEVNRSQSSNDIFPSAMNMTAVRVLLRDLIPTVSRLRDSLNEKACEFWQVIKVGRTHLMDATPLTLGQEISGYVSQLEHALTHLEQTIPHLKELAIGGTAVGTGLNSPKDFGEKMAEMLSHYSGIHFKSAQNKFEALAASDAIVNAHGAVKSLAVVLFKIANDLRWLSSGPRAGLGELSFPENEPGSSIMPGKVNPTQSEALTMMCLQVFGNDTTIGMAGASGNFELNVFRPVIIHNFLQSVRLLSHGCDLFEKFCVKGLKPRLDQIHKHLDQSLMLVTALNPYIGYDKAAQVAKKALDENKTLKEAGVELGFLTREEFDLWVNPKQMINLDRSIKTRGVDS